MNVQSIGQREDIVVRGCVETMIMLSLPHGEFDSPRVHELIAAALRHPRLKHLTYEQLYRVMRHSLLVRDKDDFDEQLRSLSALLTTQEARYTAMDVAVSVVMADGEIQLPERVRLLDLQLFMGLTDEEMEDIISRYQ